MCKKITITVIVLVIVVGLGLTAHMLDFVGLIKKLHGG